MTDILQPKTEYKIELTTKFGDDTIQHLDSSLTKVEVLTSVTLPYQAFFLTLFVDNKDIISNEIYGGDLFTLRFIMQDITGNITSISPSINLVVIDLKTEIVPVKDSNIQPNQPEKSIIQLTCVQAEALKIMTTCVNSIYKTTKIKDVISDLITKCGGNPKIDEEGINNTDIDQICIPPLPLYKVIRGFSEKYSFNKGYTGYLDSMFGIYKGVPVCWCDWQQNVYVKNLNAQLRKEAEFKIYLLSGDENADEIEKESLTGKTFYSTIPLKWTTHQNQKFVRLGGKSLFINYPRDKLWNLAEYKAEDIAQNNACMTHEYETTFFIETLNNREVYFNFPLNYEQDNTGGISYLAKNIADISEIEVVIQRFVNMNNIQNVGSPINFTSKVLDYTPLDGKYILKSARSIFTYQQGWRYAAALKLMRTNISD